MGAARGNRSSARLKLQVTAAVVGCRRPLRPPAYHRHCSPAAKAAPLLLTVSPIDSQMDGKTKHSVAFCWWRAHFGAFAKEVLQISRFVSRNRPNSWPAA
eukprot:15476152-Alexandrium_andersonii.AAC.1